MVLDTYALLKPTIEDGKARAIATTGTKRSATTPNVPTAQEGGLAGFEVTSWQGLFVRAGTPAVVIERLNRELRSVVAQDDVKDRLLQLGLEARSGTPEELGVAAQERHRKMGKGDRAGRHREAMRSLGRNDTHYVGASGTAPAAATSAESPAARGRVPCRARNAMCRSRRTPPPDGPADDRAGTVPPR